MTEDTEKLLELTTEQIEDYQRIAGEMDAQEKALSDGDVEELLEILRRKNALVEAIGQRDKEMRQLADDEVSVGEEVRQRLVELKKVAAELLEREEKSLVKLNTLRSAAGQDAMGRANARRAAEAYGGKSSTEEPRFLDKNE